MRYEQQSPNPQDLPFLRVRVHRQNNRHAILSHHCAQRAYKQRKRELKIEKVIPTATVTLGSPTILSHRDYLSCEEVADLMGISRTTPFNGSNR